MRVLFTLSFFILTFLSFGQGEANIWYFGDFAGLDFNSGSPVVLLDGALNTQEGCATISDSNGGLLFYTDGIKVWNKNHLLMPNGTDLNGSPSSTHSAIIVPKPQSSNIYYIFTVGALGGALSYSEVDMTLNSGFGDITSNKNILLFSTVNEKVTAIRKSNNDGYWVVSHKFNSDEFLIYEVTALGVNLTPIVTPVGSNTGFVFITGQIKISPDNSKLAVARGGEVQLFDFNADNGIISNPQTIDSGGGAYGIEFSANGDLLYVAFYGRVTQYNLLAGTAADIISTQVTLVTVSNEGFASMQMAPNGKIYVARQDKPYIDFIESPNVTGLGCNYQYQGLNLGGRFSRLGLPTFIQSYFNASFNFQNTCFGETTQFALTGNQNINNVAWDFGDGATATGFNPSHTYSAPGTYTVTAVVTSDTETVTRTRTLTISEIPVANGVADVSLCSLSNSYDLSQHIPTLLGNQSSDVYGVEFYNSLNEAETSLNKIANPVNLNQGNQVFFAKVFNLGNRSCDAITSFNVAWFQQPTAIQTNDYIICEAEPYDNVEIFDLSTKTVAILGTQSATDFTVSYHASLNDAETNNAPLPLLYSNGLPLETIFARVQNNANTDCFATTSFNIQVIQQPNITTIVDYLICDDASNDGFATFDLSTKTGEILNGQSNTVFEVAYFLTIDDATNGLNTILAPITNTTNPQTVFYTIAAIGNNACVSMGNFQVRVSTLPMSNAINDYYLCDIDNDLVEIFDLQSKDTEILGSQSASDFQITYHLSQNEATNGTNPLTTNHQNSSNPQTIYTRIQNVTNVDCFDTSSFVIGLYQFPIANACDDLFLCDDSNNDGSEIFDLQLNTSHILGNQSPTDFSISFHENLFDSETGNNPLPTLFTNVSNPQTIYVRIENNTGQDCYDLTSFSIEVLPSPTIDLQESYTICEGVPITIFAPTGFTSYAWSTGANNNSTIVNSAGLYSLTVTKDYGDIICENTQAFEVINSNAATILSIATVDWTSNQNSIAVYVEGDGDYEYSLDGVNYQDSNQFYGLLSGDYMVFVNDKNECGTTFKDVFLLNYPKFFTPNGDGENDFWRIKFSETESALEVIIYDRYGKLITTFKGHELGWDGTYNGQNLPSTDYWFVVTRQNGKIYKGHFSMKR